MIITYLVNLTGCREVEKREVVKVNAYFYTLVGRQGVVVILDNHFLDLIDEVTGIGGVSLAVNIDTYHDGGCKIFSHYINREVVINAAVIA